MPGVSARSANKNVSRSAARRANKNSSRVEAAINEQLEDCTFGKISKALGNKMFLVTNSKGKDHLSYIRGKMARVNVGDVVLLSIREYETRTASEKAVFDIMAVLSPKDVSRFIKANMVPSWMSKVSSEDDELNDIFDYDESSDEESEEVHNKKDKKNHRATAAKLITIPDVDSDIDVDDI
jgi:translation initiation factor IF-1